MEGGGVEGRLAVFVHLPHLLSTDQKCVMKPQQLILYFRNGPKPTGCPYWCSKGVLKTYLSKGSLSRPVTWYLL